MIFFINSQIDEPTYEKLTSVPAALHQLAIEGNEMSFSALLWNANPEKNQPTAAHLSFFPVYRGAAHHGYLAGKDQ
jgi:hypothetical protein